MLLSILIMTHINEVAREMQEMVNRGAEQYNVVFRQASTNLIVVAGIMLAFATVFVTQVNGMNFIVRLGVAGVVIFLTTSLAFGIIQQLMEAEFFRKAAMRVVTLAERRMQQNDVDADEIKGAFQEIIDHRGRAVKRWASVVQLTLLGIALGLIVFLTIYMLFAAH